MEIELSIDESQTITNNSIDAAPSAVPVRQYKINLEGLKRAVRPDDVVEELNKLSQLSDEQKQSLTHPLTFFIGKAQTAQKAFLILDFMVEEKIANTFSFNVALKHADVSKALSLGAKMKEAAIVPDSFTVKGLNQVIKRATSFDDAVQIYNYMTAAGVADLAALNALIHKATPSQILPLVQNVSVVDAYTQRAFNKSLSNSIASEEALALLDYMETLTLPDGQPMVDQISYSTALQKTSGLVALDILKRLVVSGQSIEDRTLQDITKAVHSTHRQEDVLAIIDYLVSQDLLFIGAFNAAIPTCDIQNVIRLLKTLAAREVEPDDFTIRAVNKALNLAQDYDGCMDLLMVADQLKLVSCESYNCIFPKCTVDQAISLYEEMAGRNIQPDQFTRMALTQLMVNLDSVDDARRLFDFMREQGLADEVAYTAVIGKFPTEVALASVQHLVDSGVVVDDMVLGAVGQSIRATSTQVDVPKVIEFFDALGGCQSIIWYAIVSISEPDAAIAHIVEMETRGIALDGRLARAVQDILTRSENLDEVQPLIEFLNVHQYDLA